ncbi:MAG: HNH endonuclease [Sulfitobacter sp.]|uniref:HNH endonuclease n=1 Tax=Alphaproteobacteria TaxID=28211 RepID=UPI00294222BC|nr:HNH endonuclease [Sulfitobacter sp. LC.270.F.C4]WOI16658.1 HNH endonuclease [Sulfitobacter sp. LC.270.F.C4]
MVTDRNPPWTRDELLVALDYYLRNPDDYFSPSGEGVLALTATISQIAKVLGLSGSDTLRNANGVSMKLLNFRSHDPNHDTKGLSRGNRLEKVVWIEFSNDPAALSRIVTTILDVTQAAIEVNAPVLAVDDVTEAREGKLLSRIHRYRERNAAIVKRKKASHFKQHGHLCCEACGFDFQATYGDRGEGFIECHHTKPVSELTVGETTKLSDLVLLCANCHRMVHASRPWWTLQKLRTTLC